MSEMITRFTVNGEDEEIDLGELLSIENSEAERETVSAKMAWWGSIWGQAVADLELAEAAYRSWRGSQIERELQGDSKPAEWRVMASVEALPEFRTMKEQIAQASRNATASKAVYEAFGKKAELLTRLIRRDDNDNYHGRNIGREESTDGDRERDPRVAKMKTAVGATKRKG